MTLDSLSLSAAYLAFAAIYLKSLPSEGTWAAESLIINNRRLPFGADSRPCLPSPCRLSLKGRISFEGCRVHVRLHKQTIPSKNRQRIRDSRVCPPGPRPPQTQAAGYPVPAGCARHSVLTFAFLF